MSSRSSVGDGRCMLNASDFACPVIHVEHFDIPASIIGQSSSLISTCISRCVWTSVSCRLTVSYVDRVLAAGEQLANGAALAVNLPGWTARHSHWATLLLRVQALTDLEVFLGSQHRRLHGPDDMLRTPNRTRRIERHDPLYGAAARSYSRTSMSAGRFHLADKARIIGRVSGRRRLSTSEA